MASEPATVAIVTSQRYECPENHCVGVCIRKLSTDMETRRTVEVALREEFGGQVHGVVVAEYKGSFIAFFMTPQSSDEELREYCERFGAVLRQVNITQQVEVADPLPPPRRLRLVK